jgi:hypothetical protein
LNEGKLDISIAEKGVGKNKIVSQVNPNYLLTGDTTKVSSLFAKAFPNWPSF